MASRAAKPDGLLVVAPSEERAFLHPLRVEALWGVGPKTARRLHDADLRTVGQLAQLSEAELVAVLGTGSGRRVHALAQNRDRTPVQPSRPPRSFGTQRSLAGSRARRLTAQERDETLAGLAERVTGRMAKAGYTGRTVVLRLRFADFSRATRSRTMPEPTAAPEPILATARDLLAAATPLIERQGLTMLGLSVTNLVDDGRGRPGGRALMRSACRIMHAETIRIRHTPVQGRAWQEGVANEHVVGGVDIRRTRVHPGMRTSDHTAAEWTSLGITFLVLGVALAVTVSLIIGIALAVAGLLIIVQIKLRIGPAPKPDDAPRSG